MAPTTPNQRTHGPRCSVSPALLACLACDLFISFGCIYFGKCRKECSLSKGRRFHGRDDGNARLRL